MIDGVVVIANELLALDESVNHVRLKVNIDAELTVPSNAGFLSHHFVNGIHQVNGATKALPLSIGQLRFRERVSHRVKRRSDRHPSVIVRLLWYNLASGGLVVMANVVVDQALLLRL